MHYKHCFLSRCGMLRQYCPCFGQYLIFNVGQQYFISPSAEWLLQVDEKWYGVDGKAFLALHELKVVFYLCSCFFQRSTHSATMISSYCFPSQHLEVHGGNICKIHRLTAQTFTNSRVAPHPCSTIILIITSCKRGHIAANCRYEAQPVRPQKYATFTASRMKPVYARTWWDLENRWLNEKSVTVEAGRGY